MDKVCNVLRSVLNQNSNNKSPFTFIIDGKTVID